jgi:hypothetical protein
MKKRMVIRLLVLTIVLALAALSPAVWSGQWAAAQTGFPEQPVMPSLEEQQAAQEDEAETTLLPATGNEQGLAVPAANPALASFVPTTPAMQTLMDEMTLVWLHSEEYANIISSCAGVGLRNVSPYSGGSIVLIPNAGDLDVDGSTVAIKLYPGGQVEFIPRTVGQLIRVPVDVGNKTAGQEVLRLSFEEGMELSESGHLVWTASDQGPYGNGHGLPGHIATCDPRYPGDDYYADLEDNDNGDNNGQVNDDDDDNDNDNNDDDDDDDDD